MCLTGPPLSESSERKSVSEFQALYKPKLPIGHLCWGFSYGTEAAFLSQRISSCSASVCWYFEEIQWSTFNKPLQNVPHMQTHRKTNKDANKEYGLNCFHMQIHTHTYTHTVQVTSTYKYLSVFLLCQQFSEHDVLFMEKCTTSPVPAIFFLTNKTALKSKWNSSISATVSLY